MLTSEWTSVSTSPPLSFTSKTQRSMMIKLTTPSPVIGSMHFSRIFGPHRARRAPSLQLAAAASLGLWFFLYRWNALLVAVFTFVVFGTVAYLPSFWALPSACLMELGRSGRLRPSTDHPGVISSATQPVVLSPAFQSRLRETSWPLFSRRS